MFHRNSPSNANSDQMMCSLVSDLGVHCLPFASYPFGGLQTMYMYLDLQKTMLYAKALQMSMHNRCFQTAIRNYPRIIIKHSSVTTLLFSSYNCTNTLYSLLLHHPCLSVSLHPHMLNNLSKIIEAVWN